MFRFRHILLSFTVFIGVVFSIIFTTLAAVNNPPHFPNTQLAYNDHYGHIYLVDLNDMSSKKLDTDSFFVGFSLVVS